MEIFSPKSDCGTEVSSLIFRRLEVEWADDLEPSENQARKSVVKKNTISSIQFSCLSSEALKNEQGGVLHLTSSLWGNLWYSRSLSNCATNKTVGNVWLLVDCLWGGRGDLVNMAFEAWGLGRLGVSYQIKLVNNNSIRQTIMQVVFCVKIQYQRDSSQLILIPVLKS